MTLRVRAHELVAASASAAVEVLCIVIFSMREPLPVCLSGVSGVLGRWTAVLLGCRCRCWATTSRHVPQTHLRSLLPALACLPGSARPS